MIGKRVSLPGITLLDLLPVLVPLDLGLRIVNLALELQLALRLPLLVLQLAAEPELWIWRCKMGTDFQLY